MRVILDTGIFFSPTALRSLHELDGEIVLPAVAYAERIRQLAKQGRSTGDFDGWLDLMQITVEPFGRDEAARFCCGILDDRKWRRLARDAFIAGHVRPGDVLWTTNPRDFLDLGLSGGQLFELRTVSGNA